MLYTNLKHIESANEFAGIIAENENVTVICGRMDPFSVSVYRVAEELEPEYALVKFYDMEFDNPESAVIRNLPEVQNFSGFPLTIYYKDGEVVHATVGIQTKAQVATILEHEFAATVNA